MFKITLLFLTGVFVRATTTEYFETKKGMSSQGSIPGVEKRRGTNYEPWELHSIRTPTESGTCEPPSNYQEECCLGGTYSCKIGSEPYMKVESRALELLNEGSLQLPTFDHAATTRSIKAECDICQVVNYALKYNLTMSFLGDSVQAQMWDALRCELNRRGYSYLRKQGEKLRKKGIILTDELRLWKDKDTVLKKDPFHESTTVKFFRFLRLIDNEEKNVKEIGAVAQESDILVVNFGVHWHTNEMYEYARDMHFITSILKNHSFVLLASRETTVQHFPNMGGEYVDGGRKECVAHQEAFLPWRDEIFAQAAKSNGFEVLLSDKSLWQKANRPSAANNQTMDSKKRWNEEKKEMMILPFHNFTKGLHDLHKGGEDCTHFCETPFLFAPVWRSLRLGLEYRLSKVA